MTPRIAAIVSLRRAGLSYRAIAARYGISTARAQRICVTADPALRCYNVEAPSPEIVARLRIAYRAGASLRTLMSTHGVARETVRRIVGSEMRKPGRPRRR
jgi:lambda repressor-like predicted transcriptional regulator